MSIRNLEARLTLAGVDRLPSSTPWDDRVVAWEEVAATPVFERLAARVLELAAPGEHETVVDLGAGTGLLSIPAASLAANVVAVDYSQPMLDRLAERTRREGVETLTCLRADLREPRILTGQRGDVQPVHARVLRLLTEKRIGFGHDHWLARLYGCGCDGVDVIARRLAFARADEVDGLAVGPERQRGFEQRAGL